MSKTTISVPSCPCDLTLRFRLGAHVSEYRLEARATPLEVHREHGAPAVAGEIGVRRAFIEAVWATGAMEVCEEQLYSLAVWAAKVLKVARACEVDLSDEPDGDTTP